MCDSCQALRINGVLCHETGCPEAWKSHTRECRECGCDFKPEERYQRICSDCLHDAYDEDNGMPDSMPDDGWL